MCLWLLQSTISGGNFCLLLSTSKITIQPTLQKPISHSLNFKKIQNQLQRSSPLWSIWKHVQILNFTFKYFRIYFLHWILRYSIRIFAWLLVGWLFKIRSRSKNWCKVRRLASMKYFTSPLCMMKNFICSRMAWLTGVLASCFLTLNSLWLFPKEISSNLISKFYSVSCSVSRKSP